MEKRKFIGTDCVMRHGKSKIKLGDVEFSFTIKDNFSKKVTDIEREINTIDIDYEDVSNYHLKLNP